MCRFLRNVIFDIEQYEILNLILNLILRSSHFQCHHLVDKSSLVLANLIRFQFNEKPGSKIGILLISATYIIYVVNFLNFQHSIEFKTNLIKNVPPMTEKVSKNLGSFGKIVEKCHVTFAKMPRK